MLPARLRRREGPIAWAIMLKRLSVFAKEKRNVKLNQSLFPFIPAKAGIQRFWLWVPAFAGTNGTSIQRN
jgi:hypothetical protein